MGIKKFETGEIPRKDCKNCVTDIVRFRRNVVLGIGSLDSRIVFIGEAPGYEEDKQGVPFVGRAGEVLDYLLFKNDIERRDVYITNIVKCRPTLAGKNRKPDESEIAMCIPFLLSELQKIDPDIICPMGGVALKFFDPSSSVSSSHGKIMKWENKMMIPLYHPAVALYKKEELPNMVEDMKVVAKELEKVS